MVGGTATKFHQYICEQDLFPSRSNGKRGWLSTHSHKGKNQMLLSNVTSFSLFIIKDTVLKRSNKQSWQSPTAHIMGVSLRVSPKPTVGLLISLKQPVGSACVWVSHWGAHNPKMSLFVRTSTVTPWKQVFFSKLSMFQSGLYMNWVLLPCKYGSCLPITTL